VVTVSYSAKHLGKGRATEPCLAAQGPVGHPGCVPTVDRTPPARAGTCKERGKGHRCGGRVGPQLQLGSHWVCTSDDAWRLQNGEPASTPPLSLLPHPLLQEFLTHRYQLNVNTIPVTIVQTNNRTTQFALLSNLNPATTYDIVRVCGPCRCPACTWGALADCWWGTGEDMWVK
jgi:hypothetical protein